MLLKPIQPLEYKRWLTSAVCVLIADMLMWSVVFSAAPETASGLYFLPVGQGDSQLIVLPEGQKILIDAGRPGAVGRQLADVLGPTETYIDLAVMTHPELDHFGGFLDLFGRYDFGAFVTNGRQSEAAAFTELQQKINKSQTPQVVMAEGDTIAIGKYVLVILSPGPLERVSKKANDTSLVIMLVAPSFKALYTGDIGFEVEERLVRQYTLDADVLKVPHHGSKFSSSDTFLAAVSPIFSIIGVGRNSYGHPTPAAISRLDAAASRIFRTDVEGVLKIPLAFDEPSVFKKGD